MQNNLGDLGAFYDYQKTLSAFKFFDFQLPAKASMPFVLIKTFYIHLYLHDLYWKWTILELYNKHLAFRAIEQQRIRFEV